MEENLEQLVEGAGIAQKDLHEETGSKYGKFKDADSLFTAYNNLESEYTKKCQAYSALKKEYEENGRISPEEKEKKDEVLALSREEREKLLSEYILNNAQLKDKLIARYFDDLILPSAPRLISSERGSSVVSPVSKPRTLDEAESIVKDILSKS